MQIYEERKAKMAKEGALLMTDPALSPYFEKQLHPKILLSGSFYLEEIGYERFEYGATSNAAESSNQRMKRQGEFKENTMGEQMLLFYYHQRVEAL